MVHSPRCPLSTQHPTLYLTHVFTLGKTGWGSWGTGAVCHQGDTETAPVASSALCGCLQRSAVLTHLQPMGVHLPLPPKLCLCPCSGRLPLPPRPGERSARRDAVTPPLPLLPSPQTRGRQRGASQPLYGLEGWKGGVGCASCPPSAVSSPLHKRIFWNRTE